MDLSLFSPKSILSHNCKRFSKSMLSICWIIGIIKITYTSPVKNYSGILRSKLLINRKKPSLDSPMRAKGEIKSLTLFFDFQRFFNLIIPKLDMNEINTRFQFIDIQFSGNIFTDLTHNFIAQRIINFDDHHFFFPCIGF